MHSSYTRHKINALREHGKRMADARWKADRARRDSEMPERMRELAEIEAMNLPRRQGDALGCLQWTNFATGKVNRWTIRIGDRADRITMHSPDGRSTQPHGWSWVMTKLRKFLTNHN